MYQPSTSQDRPEDKYENFRKENLSVSALEIQQEVCLGTGRAAESLRKYMLVDINSLKKLVEELACLECLECERVLFLKKGLIQPKRMCEV